MFDTIEREGYIREAADFIREGEPGKAAEKLLRLPEEETYASHRAFGQACEVLSHELLVSEGTLVGPYRASAEELESIADVIPDAERFAAVLRSLNSGEIETAWALAGEIPFDGTREHPIPNDRWNDIFCHALNGGVSDTALTPGVLKLARELFIPSDEQTLSSFMNHCFTHSSDLRITDLEDAGKAAAGKVLILGYEGTVQLEMMALLDDSYYPESIEEVGIILSWDSGYVQEGHYGSNMFAFATREWFSVCVEYPASGSRREETLWADPVPQSVAAGSNGYTSRLSSVAKAGFLLDHLQRYSRMK